MEKKIPLACVVGPTASGKTKLAVALAKALDGEVVSADSMQIYREMNVGTAKPTAEEMQGVPHHCLDLVGPDQPFSVAEYVEYARTAIGEIAGRGRLPILAGGTGLYVSSVCNQIEFSPAPSSEELRAQLRDLAEEHGNQYLWNMLREADPELAAQLHPNNRGRVIRALEVQRLTGIPMSEHQRRSRMHEPPYRLCMIGLDYRDRQKLYDRINLRVDRMLAEGLLDEVQALKERGYSGTALQAIGYKEFFHYLEGGGTLEEAAERVKRETRRYAKRQLTWFRREQRLHWLYVDEWESFQALAEQAIALARQEL